MGSDRGSLQRCPAPQRGRLTPARPTQPRAAPPWTLPGRPGLAPSQGAWSRPAPGPASLRVSFDLGRDVQAHGFLRTRSPPGNQGLGLQIRGKSRSGQEAGTGTEHPASRDCRSCGPVVPVSVALLCLRLEGCRGEQIAAAGHRGATVAVCPRTPLARRYRGPCFADASDHQTLPTAPSH